MVKKELRQKLREVLTKISPEWRHDASHRACDRLIDTREYQRAEVVMVFLSLPLEIDTTPLVLQCWRDRKRVLAPQVSWEQRRMLPVEIQSLSDDLTETRFGIREPARGVPIPVCDIDLLIVPGLGFDTAGNRIGRGRGFYDHFLTSSEWRGISCGLAFERQVVVHVPTSDHDIRVDMLVTDATTRRFDL